VNHLKSLIFLADVKNKVNKFVNNQEKIELNDMKHFLYLSEKNDDFNLLINAIEKCFFILNVLLNINLNIIIF